jgi:predicted acyltransferase
LPALGTGLLGMLAAQWLRRPGLSPRERVGGLAVAGVVAAGLGQVWSYWFPINKALWTSSFVLLAGGLALLFLALLYWLCDVRQSRRWAAPAMVYGVNAITVFFLSAILSRTFDLVPLTGPTGKPAGLKEWLYEWGIAPFFSDPRLASLVGGLLLVAIWWAILRLMHARGIHVKV